MEASAYAWIIIVIFFLVYATIHLRKCLIQLRSSRVNDLSSLDHPGSVYTIEGASGMRSYRTEQEMLDSLNKIKDNYDLPTYDQVMALDRENQNPAVANVFAGTNQGTNTNTRSNVTASSETNSR